MSVDDVFFWANWVGIVALVFGVVAACAIAISGKIRDDGLKRELSVAAERIAQLNNEAARLFDADLANARAGLAVAQAGRASLLTSQQLFVFMETMAFAQGLMTKEEMSPAARSLQIGSKVRPFAGKQFDAIIPSGAVDLEALLGSLTVALKKEGWVKVSGREQSSADHALIRGVIIDVDASKDPTLWDAAQALGSALNAEGIAAMVNPKPETDASNANVIHILIGPAP